MAATESSQNPTAKSGRNAGQFEPGNKLGAGHKQGRPKGLARRVREAVEIAGGDQNMLVTIMVQIASGYRQLIHPTDTISYCYWPQIDADPVVRPVETWQEVSVAEQQAAIRWLADRGYGKALEFVPIEDPNPLEHEGDLAAVAAGVRARVDELAAKRRERETAEAAADNG